MERAAEGHSAEHASADPAGDRWRRVGVGAAVTVLYAAMAWYALAPFPLASRRVLPMAWADPLQEAWFVGLAHWAVATGHLSFHVTTIYFPVGFNVLDQGSFPLLGVLAAPLTGIIGPVATYGAMIRTAVVVSAVVAWLVLRRLGMSVPAATVGGALYGFSPYAMAWWAYPFLTMTAIPPVVLLLLHEHLRDAAATTSPWRAATRRGALIGLLVTAQFFVSGEILAGTALVTVSTLVLLGLLGLRHPRDLAVRVAALGRLTAAALVVGGALLVYPVWFMLAGPEHYSGLPGVAGGQGIAASALVWPGTATDLAARLPHVAVRDLSGVIGAGELVGLPLLLVVAVIVVVGRRDGRVLALAAVGVTGLLWAFGPRFVVGGAATVPMPFALLEHTPVLRDLSPPRLSLFVALAVAGITAVGVDRWLGVLRLRAGPRLPRSGAALGLATAGLGIAYLAPVAPNAAVTVLPSPAEAAAALHPVPAGTVVLAYPYPRFPDDEAMLWQAADGFRFDLLGGYAYQSSRQRSVLLQTPVVHYLVRMWSAGHARARLSAEARTGLAGFLRTYRVGAVVVDLDPPPTSSSEDPHPALSATDVVGMIGATCGPGTRVGPLVVRVLPATGRGVAAAAVQASAVP